MSGALGHAREIRLSQVMQVSNSCRRAGDTCKPTNALSDILPAALIGFLVPNGVAAAVLRFHDHFKLETLWDLLIPYRGLQKSEEPVVEEVPGLNTVAQRLLPAVRLVFFQTLSRIFPRHSWWNSIYR